MEFISVQERSGRQKTLRAVIALSQGQRVVITKHGKPACIRIGCEGYDIEDVLTAADPALGG